MTVSLSYLLVLLTGFIHGEVTHPEMNGIALEDYKDFTQKWSLVTVRYRKDSGEMRFTYANESALKALKAETSNYPDGAVFGKVSFVTAEDPSFSSSVAPVAPSRVQLMVRNKKKYKKFNGWGYGLYSPDGSLMPGDMKEKTESCVACHSLVEERGHVFSRPIGYLKTTNFNVLDTDDRRKLFFKTLDIGKLPAQIKKIVGLKKGFYDDLQGVLKEHHFYGTFDEIRHTLIKQTLTTNRPSALISRDGSSFSIVSLSLKKSECDLDQQSVVSYHTGPKPKRKIIKLSLCVDKK